MHLKYQVEAGPDPDFEKRWHKVSKSYSILEQKRSFCLALASLKAFKMCGFLSDILKNNDS